MASHDIDPLGRSSEPGIQVALALTMKLRVGILWEFFPTLFCANFVGILWEFCVNFNKKGWLARSDDELLLFIYFINIHIFRAEKMIICIKLKLIQ